MSTKTTKWVAGFDWGSDELIACEVPCRVTVKQIIVDGGHRHAHLWGFQSRIDRADPRFSDTRAEALGRLAKRLQSEVTGAEDDFACLKAKLARVQAEVKQEKTP